MKKEVSSTVDILKGKDDPDTIEVEVMETDPVYVGRNIGRMVNLGDFNNLKVDVELSIPCYREEHEDVHDYVNKWTKNKLSSTLNQLLGDNDG